MCKILIRRAIDAARNFANKPVFFACDGVRMRRRVSYKVGTKEGDRTAQNSRNASHAWKKILQMAAQRAAGVPGDWRKARRRGGEWCTALHPERTTAARLHTVGGDIGGGGERRQEQEWKAGRHDETKKFGVAYWCRCSSSRVRIYILLAIYYIFIYILSIYL